MRTLVLWDVDHTLLTPGGVSREIYAAVFEEVVGRPHANVVEMAGRTDRAIVSDLLIAEGVEPTPDLVGAFAEALAAAFTAREADIAARGHVLPGARTALTALAGRDDVVQSLLTGNMPQIALCKLRAFGLDDLVDFEVGAYGLDGPERPALVGLAQERAATKYGEAFTAATTVLIGDTPYDVEAGHRGGAKVIAVATGASDENALRAAGAELVLTDLSDTAEVLRAIAAVTAQ